MKLPKEQVFQLKQAALDFAVRTPGNLIDNAEEIYQWLLKGADENEQKAKQVAANQ